MASQVDHVAEQLGHVTEQQKRLQTMIDEFRAARQRRLEKQGMDLWNRTETAYRDAVAKGDPPPFKLN
jgi:hypothetical protein